MGLLINEEDIMLTYTYIEHGKFELREKPEPEIVNSREAIVRSEEHTSELQSH